MRRKLPDHKIKKVIFFLVKLTKVPRSSRQQRFRNLIRRSSKLSLRNGRVFTLEDNDTQDTLILPSDIDVEQQLEVRELVDAACLFSMDIGAIKHDWKHCDEAMKLRVNGIPKIPAPV